MESLENKVLASENEVTVGSGIQTNEGANTKQCKECGRILPVSEFNKRASAKDGYQEYCRCCQKRQQKEYYLKKKGLKESRCEVQAGLSKVYAYPELAKFQPRQLMEELKARGFVWDHMLEPRKKIYFEKI